MVRGTREEAQRWREWVLRCAEGVSRIPTDDLHDLYDFLERIEAHLPSEAAVRHGSARLLRDLGEDPAQPGTASPSVPEDGR